MSVEYDIILERLKERILEKHEEYGTSYLLRSDDWLLKRLEGELEELRVWDNVIEEALDVAICALLIADKKRRLDEMKISRGRYR